MAGYRKKLLRRAPVLVMRNTTERPEAVEAGDGETGGTNAEAIVGNVTELLHNKELYRRRSETHNPYGDGHACVNVYHEAALGSVRFFG